MKRKTNNHILVNDPSITAWGWVVLDWDGKIKEAGCIKTEKNNKKLKIRAGDDKVRRISEINQVLRSKIQQYNVNYIVSELPHGSQSASAAIMIGIVTGIVQTICDFMVIGVEWYSEGDAKKALLGSLSASKDEVMRAVDKLYLDIPWTGTKYKDEAIADAMAIYNVACQQSSLFKIMKNN